jgi:hypothetical protein
MPWAFVLPMSWRYTFGQPPSGVASKCLAAKSKGLRATRTGLGSHLGFTPKRINLAAASAVSFAGRRIPMLLESMPAPISTRACYPDRPWLDSRHALFWSPLGLDAASEQSLCVNRSVS